MVNTKILERSDQLKKQFEEESIEFSKKGCRSAGYVNYINMTLCNNSDYSSENSETSKRRTGNNPEEVSISLVINDDNDKPYPQRDMEVNDLCRMPASKPLKPQRHSKTKNFSRSQFDQYTSAFTSPNENLDRSKYFRTICAGKSFDMSKGLDFDAPSYNFVSQSPNLTDSHQSRRRFCERKKHCLSNSDTTGVDEEYYDSDDAVNCFYKRSRNRSRSNFDSSQEQFNHSEYRSRLENYKKESSASLKVTKEKRVRIQQLLEVLTALREESPDSSDSSDSISYEKIELLNKILKKKMKNLDRLSKESEALDFNSNRRPRPEYNAYGIVREIPYRYSRPRLPPIYRMYKFGVEEAPKEKSAVKLRKTHKTRSKSRKRRSKETERTAQVVGVYSRLPVVGDRPNKKEIIKQMQAQQKPYEKVQPSIQVFYGLNRGKNVEKFDSATEIESSLRTEEADFSSQNLDTVPNSEEIESDKEELSKFPEDLPLNDSLLLTEENQIAGDDFIQQISRQMRITFFKEKPKIDEINYEANLPVLPPAANLNASDSKVVNKQQLVKKRYSSKQMLTEESLSEKPVTVDH